MLALKRTFALAKLHTGPGAVAQHLHLDMSRARQEPFNIDSRIAERRFRLRLAPLDGGGDLIRGLNDPHAAAASARDSLDQHRCALRQMLEERGRPGGVHCAGGSRNGRHAEFFRPVLGRDLVAEELEAVRRRPDKGEPGGLHRLGEGDVLAQESVSRMDSVASGLACDLDDPSDVEIGAGAGGAERNSVIGAPCMQALLIIRRMDGDSLDPHFGGGSGNANGDLATIGDQQLSYGHDFGASCRLRLVVAGRGNGGSVLPLGGHAVKPV